MGMAPDACARGRDSRPAKQLVNVARVVQLLLRIEQRLAHRPRALVILAQHTRDVMLILKVILIQGTRAADGVPLGVFWPRVSSLNNVYKKNNDNKTKNQCEEPTLHQQ